MWWSERVKRTASNCAVLKIGPGGDSSVNAQPLRSSDKIGVGIDRDDRESILKQARREFALNHNRSPARAAHSLGVIAE